MTYPRIYLQFWTLNQKALLHPILVPESMYMTNQPRLQSGHVIWCLEELSAIFCVFCITPLEIMFNYVVLVGYWWMFFVYLMRCPNWFNSYILEGKELEFYMKKIQRKKGKGAARRVYVFVLCSSIHFTTRTTQNSDFESHGWCWY